MKQWIFAFALAACTRLPPEPPISNVEAGVAVADDACTLLTGVDDDGTLRTVCATIEEIGQIVSFILTLRPIDAGGVASCAPLPGSKVCATQPEIAKAILYLARRRQVRFIKAEDAQ